MHIERLKLLETFNRRNYFEKIINNGNIILTFIDKDHLELEIDSEIFIINRTNLIDSIFEENEEFYYVRYGIYHMNGNGDSNNPYKTIIKYEVLLDIIRKNKEVKIFSFDEKRPEDNKLLAKIKELKNI